MKIQGHHESIENGHSLNKIYHYTLCVLFSQYTNYSHVIYLILIFCFSYQAVVSKSDTTQVEKRLAEVQEHLNALKTALHQMKDSKEIESKQLQVRLIYRFMVPLSLFRLRFNQCRIQSVKYSILSVCIYQVYAKKLSILFTFA